MTPRNVRCLDLHSTFNLDVIFCMKMSEMTSDVLAHLKISVYQGSDKRQRVSRKEGAEYMSGLPKRQRATLIAMALWVSQKKYVVANPSSLSLIKGFRGPMPSVKLSTGAVAKSGLLECGVTDKSWHVASPELRRLTKEFWT